MLGIDISKWQGTVNWAQVRARGITAPVQGPVEFAICKATELNAVDPKFNVNFTGARAAGIPVGAYHFFRSDRPAPAQAAAFVAALNSVGYGAGDLVPVIDIEHPDGNHGGGAAAPATMPDDLAAFCQAVQAAMGPKLMVYTGGWWWRPFYAKYKPRLTGYQNRPLWLSGFTQRPPATPQPWSATAIWQFTDKGKVGGITGNVDLNRAESISGLIIP